ncbi:MAG: hypothetical protein E6J73_22750 [Deltaproteobacteria bacterium]|jgi:hypothetical protein|nr:MAG: hypothetical protein E6J73_22750 [Deltaproteobacteria bacterium]
MDFDESLISHTLEHRGCGIRAASYEITPQSWLPEACVWLHTDVGHRKMWVHSFAHCFAAEELTFPSRLDADSWALGAARSIIDRAFEELNLPAVGYVPHRVRNFARVWKIARSSLSNLARLNRFGSRH